MNKPLPRLRALPAWPASLVLLLAVLFSGCRKAGPPLTPYVAFVANNQSNSVAAVDLASFRVIRSIAVAPEPIEVVARPRSRQLLVASASGTITVIGFPDLRIVGTWRVAASVGGFAVSPDGIHLYVLDLQSGEIVFGDGEHGQVPHESGRVHVGGTPVSLALTPDAKTLIVADRGSSRLIFLNTQSRQLLGTVEVGKGPDALAILPDGSKVFAADTGEHKISAVSVDSRQILAHLELAAAPTLLALKPDGGELFVLCGERALLAIVDTFHDNVEENHPAGHAPAAAVFRRDSSVLYTADAGDGSVTALDVQNRVVLDSTHAGAEPRALALTPDERYLVVADAGSASVAILRAVSGATAASDRGALVTMIPVGARPVAVAIPGWEWKED
ncbi:MAG TPA: beta-propeller fold lactonase family protein [Terriglobia bacterium]|nr:beta-propeller fold lactonase family protein [Terriglobia bacterium]